MITQSQLPISKLCLSQNESFGTVFKGSEANSYPEFSHFQTSSWHYWRIFGEIGTLSEAKYTVPNADPNQTTYFKTLLRSGRVY